MSSVKWMCIFILFYSSSVKALESITVAVPKVADIKEENSFYSPLLKKIYPNKMISTQTMEFKYSIELFLNNKVDAIVAVFPHEVPNAILPNWILDKDLPITAYYLKQTFTSPPQLDDSTLNVGWLHRYGFDKFFKIKNGYEVSNRDIGFRMLDRGRIDVFLDYKEHNHHRDLKTYECIDVKEGSYLYIAFQNNEKGKRLANQFDEKMLKLSNAGELEKIYGAAYQESGLADFKPKTN